MQALLCNPDKSSSDFFGTQFPYPLYENVDLKLPKFLPTLQIQIHDLEKKGGGVGSGKAIIFILGIKTKQQQNLYKENFSEIVRESFDLLFHFFLFHTYFNVISGICFPLVTLGYLCFICVNLILFISLYHSIFFLYCLISVHISHSLTLVFFLKDINKLALLSLAICLKQV